MDPTSLIARLADIVGIDHVLTGDDVCSRASHFWDPSPLRAAAIVRPADTAETAAVMTLCHEAGQSVICLGGATGLVKGHASDETDILLSTERMNRLEHLDVIGRTATVGAGAILEKVQRAASEAGLQLCIDLGARGSCTIGGNIATNAGGLSVLRYGMAREQVLGLEVVLADGTIISSMNRMLKNNAGYDLKQLFTGSEGTLGIITRAVLRLRPATPARATALLAFGEFEQLSATLALLGEQLDGTLDAFEAIWQPFFALNTDPANEGSSRSPLSREHPLYAIVESRGHHAEQTQTRLERTLAAALEAALVDDAVIVQSERERAEIWHIREHIDIALQHDPVFTYDVSLPIADMPGYVSDIRQSLEAHWPGVRLYVYGHLADGNLHVLVAPPTAQPLTAKERDDWQRASHDRVFAPLQALGGSISAEHGIGLSRKPWLSLSRTPAEIALMRTMKQALDPTGILNPGKVID